jgi:hypothetical protein
VIGICKSKKDRKHNGQMKKADIEILDMQNIIGVKRLMRIKPSLSYNGWFGVWCLMLLSRIFQLYRGCQFKWWGNRSTC